MAPRAFCCFAVFTMWCELNNCLLFFIVCQNTDYFSSAETFRRRPALDDSARSTRRFPSHSAQLCLISVIRVRPGLEAFLLSCQATCLLCPNSWHKDPLLAPQGPISVPAAEGAPEPAANRKWLRQGFLWPGLWAQPWLGQQLNGSWQLWASATGDVSRRTCENKHL